MSTAADKQKTAPGRFPADEFRTIPRVVVFAEHRTKLRDGTPVTYDRDALERIAANCNRRIEETGNYAGVCLGHTDKDDGDKPLIGFAGPFRVEDRDGKAVLTADLHIFKEDFDKLRRYPRPSPEVWIPTDGFDPDRIFLDPIALLGAETPRLDLGMTFLYRARDGTMQCEKYAAHPSAGSVAIPLLGAEQKGERYQMAANLTPEDIQAILKAIEATDWFAWLRQQMAASRKPDGDAGGADAPPKDDPASKDRYAKDDDDDDDAPPPDDGGAKADQGAAGAPPPPPQDRPKRIEEYKCTTHYARREAVMEAQKELYQLRRELEKERALRVNSERRRVLESLARRYVVDVDDELAMCAYGKLDDAAFDKHVARIEKYYRLLPVDQTMPVWGEAYALSGDMTRETYQRKQDEELSRKAVEYARRCANRGKSVSYDEALEVVKSGKAR